MSLQTFTMHLYADEDYDYKTGAITTKFLLVPWAKTDASSAFGQYVGPVEVQAEVPDSFDMRAAKLQSLRDEQAKVRAEMTQRITDLQRQINELLAIEA